jgi:PhnB protein
MHADFKPVGWPAVVPRLVTSDVQGVVTFLRSTFGAEGDIPRDRPAEMRIFDAIIMVSDGGGIRQSSSAFLYVYVEDTDATYQRAIEAGAREVVPPADMPYGDRRATVQDVWGNTWQIATRKRP